MTDYKEKEKLARCLIFLASATKWGETHEGKEKEEPDCLDYTHESYSLDYKRQQQHS